MIRSTPRGAVWERLLADFPRLTIFLAGGSLRDLLHSGGRKPKDLDLFLEGNDLEAALAKLSLEGTIHYGPFGSPRWFPLGTCDFYCDLISVPRFFNGLWSCRDIVDVLNQFDFTANAVALDIRSGAFHDPQNGRRDLSQGMMKAVRFDYPEEPIAPGQRLSRPSVVWFRILHYAAALGLKIEPVTLRWLRAHQSHLALTKDFETLFFPLSPSMALPLAAAGAITK